MRWSATSRPSSPKSPGASRSLTSRIDSAEGIAEGGQPFQLGRRAVALEHGVAMRKPAELRDHVAMLGGVAGRVRAVITQLRWRLCHQSFEGGDGRVLRIQGLRML